MDTGIAVTPGDYSEVTLESRFTDFDTPVLLTGIQALVRILLEQKRLDLQPGLNEDMAATMIYGTQQLDAFPGAKVDGVFGMWYGKGPGVDRTADAFRCANFMGTSKHGGVLAVSGDDHSAHSSPYPHQN